jgi:hypothetical protein
LLFCSTLVSNSLVKKRALGLAVEWQIDCWIVGSWQSTARAYTHLRWVPLLSYDGFICVSGWQTKSTSRWERLLLLARLGKGYSQPANGIMES